jgi:hypothetical protein
MSTNYAMIVSAVTVVILLSLLALVWREQPRDEREAGLILGSNRAGYVVGVMAISVMILYNTYRHQMSNQLMIILGLMVAAKLLTRRK